MLSGNDIPHSLPNYICISLKYSTTIFPLIKHMVLYFYDTRILPVISKIIRNICNTLTLWSTTEVLKHFSVKFLIIELQGKFNFSISIVYIEVIYDHSRWIFSISTFQIVDILPIIRSDFLCRTLNEINFFVKFTLLILICGLSSQSWIYRVFRSKLRFLRQPAMNLKIIFWAQIENFY